MLALAAWLEYMIIYGRNEESDFVFAYRGSTDKCSINRKASDIMKSVLKDPEFEIILKEKKGTHSMSKFATWPRNVGFIRMILIYVFVGC